MVIGQFSIWLKVLASLKRYRLELNGVSHHKHFQK